MKTFRNRIRVAAAVISVGAVALLAGCSNINAAVTVDKEVVTVDTIQKSYNSILKERGTIDTSSMDLPRGADLSRNIANLYVTTVIIDHVGALKKVSVTDEEIAQYEKDQIASIGGEKNLKGALIQNSLAREDLKAYFKRALTVQKIAIALGSASDTTAATNYILDYAKKVHVKVNSRYGVWDASQVSIVAADPTSGAVTTPTK